MKTLNIIGAGRVGRACGRMWAEAGVFAIQDVSNRSRESAVRAVAFIGVGRAVGGIADMRTADVWLIATGDDDIEAGCDALAGVGKVAPGNIVFHVSGATASAALAAAARRGALTASVHPLKTFPDSAGAVASFPGTYCGAEGHPAALAVLTPAFERIGATVFTIAADLKLVYHAAGVFSCNYLAALVEAALLAHEKAGIPRAASLRALEPLVRETVDAVFSQGPAHALTGPIARGDVATVGRQAAALQDWHAGLAALYRHLGRIAVELARRDGRLDEPRAVELRTALRDVA